jgi:hypothetical protein
VTEYNGGRRNDSAIHGYPRPREAPTILDQPAHLHPLLVMGMRLQRHRPTAQLGARVHPARNVPAAAKDGQHQEPEPPAVPPGAAVAAVDLSHERGIIKPFSCHPVYFVRIITKYEIYTWEIENYLTAHGYSTLACGAIVSAQDAAEVPQTHFPFHGETAGGAANSGWTQVKLWHRSSPPGPPKADASCSQASRLFAT